MWLKRKSQLKSYARLFFFFLLRNVNAHIHREYIYRREPEPATVAVMPVAGWVILHPNPSVVEASKHAKGERQCGIIACSKSNAQVSAVPLCVLAVESLISIASKPLISTDSRHLKKLVTFSQGDACAYFRGQDPVFFLVKTLVKGQ
jgi:hypothetical protein